MESQRTKNGLLFVIAACLVLIVLKLYSVDFVREAEAADSYSYSRLLACSRGTQCVRHQDWIAVRANTDGTLYVNTTR